MNVALIGFMGVGKTTVSRALSERTGWEEIDTDQWIVEKEGRAITEIFKTEGETAFRDIETAAIRELSALSGKILSCGGGAVLRPCNVEALKSHGLIVLLTARLETIFERVRYGKDRPILNGNMNVSYIAQLMEKRRPAYEAAADIVVETDGKKPARIAAEIEKQVLNYKNCNKF